MLLPVFDGADFLRRQWNRLVLGFNAERQKDLLGPLGIKDADAWQLVVAFAIGSTLALLLTLWFLLHEHRDRSDPLVAAWRAFAARLQVVEGVEDVLGRDRGGRVDAYPTLALQPDLVPRVRVLVLEQPVVADGVVVAADVAGDHARGHAGRTHGSRGDWPGRIPTCPG